MRLVSLKRGVLSEISSGEWRVEVVLIISAAVKDEAANIVIAMRDS